MQKRSRALGALMIAASPLVAQAQGARPPAPRRPPPAASSAPPPPSPPPPDPAAAKLEAAKDLFRKGNAELEAGHLEQALDYFLLSRAQIPSVANTNNAALTLEKLGRLDEALALYEELQTAFSDRLTSDERTAVNNKVTLLRGQVGLLEVTANVDGVLVIDGRRRGTVPLTAPVRVPPGPHTVQVLKDGYAAAEATVTVSGGQRVPLALKLEALSAAGRLRVSDRSGAPDVEVLIDGAPVGMAPWEGTLGPGRHLASLRGKGVGSAPTPVMVLVGQTVQAELSSQPLGPSLTVIFEPTTAALSVDGVALGPGPWRGALPAGDHTFEASEEGYQTARVVVGATQPEARVTLAIQEDHPRWRQGRAGHWNLTALLGAPFGNGMNSQAEKSCTGCSSSAATGYLGGLSLAYHLRNGLIFEGQAGVLKVQHDFRRQQIIETNTYTIDDSLSLRGPYAQLGVGYQLPFAARWRGSVRFGVGLFFAKISDPVKGQITAASSTVATDLVFQNPEDSKRAPLLFLAPQVGIDHQLAKHLWLGVSLSPRIFLLDGPSLEHGEALPNAPCNPQNPATCAQGTRAFDKERAFSAFALWTPQLSLGWEFLKCLLARDLAPSCSPLAPWSSPDCR